MHGQPHIRFTVHRFATLQLSLPIDPTAHHSFTSGKSVATCCELKQLLAQASYH